MYTLIEQYMGFCIFGGILFIALTIHLYRMLAAYRLEHPLQVSIRSRVLGAGFLLVLLLVGGYQLPSLLEKQEKEELNHTMYTMASSFADTLQRLGYTALPGDYSMDEEDAETYKEAMAKWMELHPEVAALYTIRKEGTQGVPSIRIGYNREDHGLKPLQAGSTYQAQGTYLDDAFEGTLSIEPRPSENMFGYHQRAFAPTFGRYGGLQAVLGMDMEGKLVDRQLQDERTKGFLLLFLALILLHVMYYYMVRSILERAARQYRRNLIKASEARYRVLSDANVEGMIIHRQGQILEVNRAMAELMGYSKEELLQMTIFELVIPDQVGTLLEHSRRGVEDTYLVKGRRKDGSVFDAEVHARAVMYDGQLSRASAVRDVTFTRAQSEMIEHMAFHDDLTGLYNKKYFIQTLKAWLQEADRNDGSYATLLFMDLNNFKQINDVYGHRTGDEVMKECARRLQDANVNGGLLARWEGDEFAVWLSGVRDEAGALEAAERFMHTLRAPIQSMGIPYTLGVSIGISLYPRDGTDEDTLLRKADAAMFLSKKERAVRFFHATLQERLESRSRLEQDLRHAIERDQLEVYYQPQVWISNNEWYGVEALLRWKHPELGFVSPAEFIPLAEETGLILSIGDWVLRRACQDMALLQKQGMPPMKVAVNLSVIQFSDKDLVDKVKKALDDSGLPANELELEITESMMMNPEHALSVLVQLKVLGVRISIDDFGTGYSSLQYLHLLPIDKLKIDRSFVVGLDGRDAPITEAIVSLAKSMHLELIAEGVETERQAESLLELGCLQAQGYLFERPMPLERLEASVKKLRGGSSGSLTSPE